MPRFAKNVLAVFFVAFTVAALFVWRDAYRAGLRPRDVLLTPVQLVAAVSGMAVVVLLVSAALRLKRRVQAEMEARWRASWPSAVTTIEFYGNHEILKAHLENFARAVGARFVSAAAPSGGMSDNALFVWHLGRDPSLGVSPPPANAQRVLVLATRNVAQQLRSQYPGWHYRVYPFGMRSLLDDLSAVAAGHAA